MKFWNELVLEFYEKNKYDFTDLKQIGTGITFFYNYKHHNIKFDFDHYTNLKIGIECRWKYALISSITVHKDVITPEFLNNLFKKDFIVQAEKYIENQILKYDTEKNRKENLNKIVSKILNRTGETPHIYDDNCSVSFTKNNVNFQIDLISNSGNKINYEIQSETEIENLDKIIDFLEI